MAPGLSRGLAVAESFGSIVAQVAEIALSGVGRVAAVSCNPATFARDARHLVDAGFRIERILPVDQFLWSPHLELTAIFSR